MSTQIIEHKPIQQDERMSWLDTGTNRRRDSTLIVLHVLRFTDYDNPCWYLQTRLRSLPYLEFEETW
jgi:hypothetical protein